MNIAADMDWQVALPLIFAGLMVTAFLIYAVLDGFDLGVGLLLPMGTDEERNTMLASIGPFWDANETWLVLGVGLLLIAFPSAHSFIMGKLYIAVLVLLVGLILRGVAFDFRAKVPSKRQALWDRLFFIGSLMATTTQGYMLGKFVVGFASDLFSELFCLLSAICVAAAYAFIGSAWLIMKSSALLQSKAVGWAQRSLWLMMLGIAAVSIANPLLSPIIFDKWFSLPQAIILLPIPVLCGFALCGTAYYLRLLQRSLSATTNETDPTTANHIPAMSPNLLKLDWLPFAAAVLVFFLSFQGLSYSFYPYIVPFEIDLWQAAAATESLAFLGVGVAIVFPAILAYTVLAYRVFWGKATALNYY